MGTLRVLFSFKSISYIFLDESGDLGFKKNSSKWFLFTIAMTNDTRALEKVIKKVWRPLKKKHKRLGELHAYRADGYYTKEGLKAA